MDLRRLALVFSTPAALTASACGQPESGDPTAGTVTEAILEVDIVECRNSGSVLAFDREWRLAEPVPDEWRNIAPIAGQVRFIDDSTASFVAGVDEVRVTTGSLQSECILWTEDDS